LTWSVGGDLRPVARPAGGRGPRHPLLDEVSAALVGLGWKPAEADAAVGELAITPGITTEALLRQALRSMPR
jgi:Holliday junction resolvasome RuvABC DNA-binding subunit